MNLTYTSNVMSDWLLSPMDRLIIYNLKTNDEYHFKNPENDSTWKIGEPVKRKNMFGIEEPVYYPIDIDFYPLQNNHELILNTLQGWDRSSIMASLVLKAFATQPHQRVTTIRLPRLVSFYAQSGKGNMGPRLELHVRGWVRAIGTEDALFTYTDFGIAQVTFDTMFKDDYEPPTP